MITKPCDQQKPSDLFFCSSVFFSFHSNSFQKSSEQTGKGNANKRNQTITITITITNLNEMIANVTFMKAKMKYKTEQNKTERNKQ